MRRQRIFPVVVEERRALRRRAGAARSPSDIFATPSSRRALTAMRAGRWPKAWQGRRRGLLMPNRAGLSGRLARPHPHRRRGGADQHQSCGRGAGPLPRAWPAEAHHRRRRVWPGGSWTAAGAGSGVHGADLRGASIEGIFRRRADVAERREVTLGDPALLIYTSGTTGLPKAAYVSHRRVMSWSHWFAGMMDAATGRPALQLPADVSQRRRRGGDRARRCWAAASVVIAREILRQPLLDDVGDSGSTLPVYRRALPLSSGDAGARADRTACAWPAATAWRPTSGKPFQERFAIPQILEFYAATEGNFSLYNAEGKPGAIGRIPAFLAHRFPAAS